MPELSSMLAQGAGPTQGLAPDGAASDMGDTDQAQQGYTICIHVGPDGSISVGVESASDEQAEALGGGEESLPVGSIREALDMVRQIYAVDGQMPDDGEQQAAFAEASQVPEGM